MRKYFTSASITKKLADYFCTSLFRRVIAFNSVSNFISETNGGSPKKQQPVSEKPVDLREVVKVLNGVYGASQNIEKEESTFPLQQQLLLCSLMLILNKGRNKDITINKVIFRRSKKL